MPWEVVSLPEFDGWFEQLDEDQQDALADRLDLLRQWGPDLGRPIVDSLKDSRHHNMKELI